MSLTVTIYSFSYHIHGIPTDPSDHKGGFVFDCRCLPNPGRRQDFAQLTGRDEVVRTYLASIPEVQAFLKSTFALVDLAVGNYLQRGFDHLMVSYGCTGGQHRSVYCAEMLADHLRERGVRVEFIHLSLQSET